MKNTKFLSGKQAAAALGIGKSRISQLCTSGILVAHKPGRDWMITAKSVGNYQRQRRGPGRPGRGPAQSDD